MRTLTLTIVVPAALLCACDQFNDKATPDDPQSRGEVGSGYNYVPLDPLPATVVNDSRCENLASRPILDDLPDNAVRIAVRQLSGKGNVGFGPAQVGVEGSSYQVILDYINTNMENVRFRYSGGDLSKGQVPSFLTRIDDQYSKPEPNEIIIPVYVGIGLGLTANVTVRKGTVNLGSLGGLAAAADAQKVSGSLIVQTLGITGGQVASTLPLPSELNPTTIQNAIQALGAVKASVHDKENTIVTPRVTGIYNPLPSSNPQTINQIVSGLARGGVSMFRTCEGAGKTGAPSATAAPLPQAH
jgi:hypothetical protein